MDRDRIDPMGIDRLLNLGEAPAPTGYDREFFQRLAEVFLERGSGGPDAVEAAVTHRLPDARGEVGMLRMAGVASIRGSECRLVLESDPAHVPGVVDWLIYVTASTLPDIRQRRLRSVLYELLCNAMEHGNLEIGCQEKRQALVQDRYEDVLRQRLADPRLNARQITIHVRHETDAGRLTYRIVDEGSGFPWRQYFDGSDAAGGPDAVNGRGIHLARSLSTDLTYNERGNEVLMTMT